ncbi:hypothetical protein NLJ89_g597 [Agrocybe chaxingu]|uniref:Uncharacterized protein n=1 Tax=Agrocybe chaxingu TaxID=84603 RepID=A0A9W8N1P9_9AGAR|nr:hypothetical protein NLJ89_g597 [Agrocybe chaxingu]
MTLLAGYFHRILCFKRAYRRRDFHRFDRPSLEKIPGARESRIDKLYPSSTDAAVGEYGHVDGHRRGVPDHRAVPNNIFPIPGCYQLLSPLYVVTVLVNLNSRRFVRDAANRAKNQFSSIRLELRSTNSNRPTRQGVESETDIIDIKPMTMEKPQAPPIADDGA